MTTAEDSVVVRNIWYMLAYAYRALDVRGFARITTEDFENVNDLLGAILAAGLEEQRSRGFERGYVDAEEDLAGIRGRIDLAGTIRHKVNRSNLVRCVHDDYTADTLKNRILKATALALLGDDDVKHETKASLKRSVMLMREVGRVDPKSVDWRRLRYHRNNRSYELLMGVCWMVLRNQIASEREGKTHFGSFVDDQQLHQLYEKFVLEYFRRHHPELHATAKEIPRKAEGNVPSFLPHLQTDITITNERRTLIIDTKCYGRILRTNFYGKEMLSPAHLNQIQSYVLHEQYGNQKKVEGMLLYALTDRDSERNEHWSEVGMDLYCYTLDLGQDFSRIAARLEEIASIVQEAEQ
ncbi:MAG: hypothetical protein ACI364_04775 [Coriobacteriales bacterium]